MKDDLTCLVTQIRHVIGSIGVLNNHETYSYFFLLKQTDRQEDLLVVIAKRKLCLVQLSRSLFKVKVYFEAFIFSLWLINLP